MQQPPTSIPNDSIAGSLPQGRITEDFLPHIVGARAKYVIHAPFGESYFTNIYKEDGIIAVTKTGFGRGGGSTETDQHRVKNGLVEQGVPDGAGGTDWLTSLKLGAGVGSQWQTDLGGGQTMQYKVTSFERRKLAVDGKEHATVTITEIIGASPPIPPQEFHCVYARSIGLLSKEGFINGKSVSKWELVSLDLPNDWEKYVTATDDGRVPADRTPGTKNKKRGETPTNQDYTPAIAKPTVEKQKPNDADSLATVDNSDNATKPDGGDFRESDQPKPTKQPPQPTEQPKAADADDPKSVSLTGTWKNASGVKVKITDDGTSIKIQVGETHTLVSLMGSLTRTEKPDAFEGTVKIIPKADHKRTPLNIPVKATLLNPNELQLTYGHWPSFNKKGIRQIEDTRAEDTLRRN